MDCQALKQELNAMARALKRADTRGLQNGNSQYVYQVLREVEQGIEWCRRELSQ